MLSPHFRFDDFHYAFAAAYFAALFFFIIFDV